MIAVDDRLVHLRAAVHVVRLDGQHLLQRVRSAVGLERPHLHLAKALSTELRLAAERLLRDERVRARRASVHLVVDQVVQLQHVHVADRDFALEALARATVVQDGLTAERQVRECKHVLDLFLVRTVEHRRRHRHAVTQVAGERNDLIVRERGDVGLLAAGLVVDLIEETANRRRASRLIEHAPDLETDALRCPAEMRFQDLADVHTRRHTERIEHDVDRRTVLGVRHVFDWNDRRHDALVSMASRHLVARLNAALHGQVHLDHLQDARRQIVARGDLRALLFVALLELLALRLQTLRSTLDRCIALFVLQTNLEPLLAREIGEVRLVDDRAGAELLRTGFRSLAQQHRTHALEQVVFENAALIFEVLANLLELRLLDRKRARVLLDAVAREHAHVDDRTIHARRHAERSVLHVRCLLTENRAQELLFRRQLRLALRRDLADENVARLHFRADERDACFIQFRERDIAHVRDVRGDLLGAQLRVASDAGQLLDVNGREAIVMDDALRDQDRVFEVVAVPRHERDEQVLTEGELTEVRRRTVREHVAARDHVACLHEGTLVDTRVLVRTRVLGHRIDIDAGFRC